MMAVTDSAPDATPRPLPGPERPDGGRPAGVPPEPPSAAPAETPSASAPGTRTKMPVASRRDGFPVWPQVGVPPATPAARKPVTVGDAAWLVAPLRAGRLSLADRLLLADRSWARSLWHRPRRPRPPAVGLGGLVLFALLAAFFAWVSADPFWLAVGHAERGTATVTRCAGSGLSARCVGSFTAPAFSRDRVALSALPRKAARPGVTVPARMVTRSGRIAYAGGPVALHARWLLGFLLVASCGFGVGWATGAGRLADPRARTAGYAASVAAPVLLLIGMLIVSW
jgi:hypothetical protein